MCALEKASIEDLNGRAVGYERMGIEKTVFERCTELPTIFKEEDDKTASTRKPDEGGNYLAGASVRMSKDDAKMSDETGGLAEPEKDDVPMEQPTKRRKIEGIEKLSEKFEAFVDESRRVKFCLHCHGNHFISDCELVEASETMKYYENLQTRLHDGTVGEPETSAQASSDPSASSTKQHRRWNGRKSDHDCFAPRDTGVQAQMKGKKINLAFMTMEWAKVRSRLLCPEGYWCAGTNEGEENQPRIHDCDSPFGHPRPLRGWCKTCQWRPCRRPWAKEQETARLCS
eukprot:s4154_g3.t1